MIYSMTALCTALKSRRIRGDAVWEIRSVNQRYLKTFPLARAIPLGLENALREKLRQNLTRVKLNVHLRIDSKNKRRLSSI